MARSSAGGVMQTTIDQGAADTTTTANVGERIRSSDATLAISLGSGVIDDSDTIINSSGLGAIQINRCAAISNLSGGSIVGLIDIRATDTASSSFRNAGGFSGKQIIISADSGKFRLNNDSVMQASDQYVIQNLNDPFTAAQTIATYNLNAGSMTTRNVGGGAGTDVLMFNGAGVLQGNVSSVEFINKSGAGTFRLSGSSTAALVLAVSGGTLNRAPAAPGQTIQVLNAQTTITGSGSLVGSDGSTFRSPGMAVSGAGSSPVVGGAVTANDATRLGAGTSFTVAPNSAFQVENLAMNQATGVVGGALVVNGVSTLTDSFITVDSGGPLDADMTYTNTDSIVNGDGAYVDGLVDYTDYDFKTLRSVIFTGFNEVNRARHDADALTAYVGAGWMSASGDGSWGPTASQQWTSLDFDGLTETGGVSALTVAPWGVDSLRSQLGIRGTRRYEVHQDYTMVPEVQLRWVHEFVNDDRAINASFALAPGITPFTALADHRNRDSAFLGASVNAFFKGNLSAFLNYDADLGRQGSRVDAGRYGLAFKF